MWPFHHDLIDVAGVNSQPSNLSHHFDAKKDVGLRARQEPMVRQLADQRRLEPLSGRREQYG